MLEFDRRYVLVPVLLAIALVAIAFFATEVGRSKLISSVQNIQRSQQRARLLVELQSLITDAETAQRGFVLTGEEAYLEPFSQAKEQISDYTMQLQTAYGVPEQAGMQPLAKKLIELSAAKLQDLESTVALYRQGKPQALALVRTDLGRQTMASLRELVSDMRTRERNMVVAQTNEWLKVHATLRVMTAIGALLNVALIILAGYLVSKDIRRRVAVAAQLETEVHAKTRDLSELSTHLQRMSEAEKSALARELHDELGGLLVAIKMDLAQLRTKIDFVQDGVQKRWDRIQAALSTGIDMKRRIIEQLRPSLLDNMGLVAALRWQAEEICNSADITLRQHYPEGELALSSDAAIAIFRIVQEALTNIAKFAKARNVLIDLKTSDTSLILTVQDDGVDVQQSGNDHRTVGMRHRLLPFEGEFSVENIHPGTRICVKLLLSRIAAHAELGT
jgi:signal transduction histidine kinase